MSETRPGRNGGTLKSGGSKSPGRPKKIPELKEVLSRVMGEDKDGITAMEAVFMQLRKKAASGDIRAIQILLEYAYGKPKQVISNDPDSPFTSGQVQLVLIASGVEPITSEIEAEIIDDNAEGKALPNP
jgi:hypothetical protein